ncbi:phenylalanyl-tRNA synthetase subunit beta [Gymnopus androsaceus JB14]|uniref:phenylalanine--tRNA ligase n=1 Tax=Gymnopus androsaceus JB14 TaxID=1447944 RepID=A0A6A4HF96_9AGAR|nr:phenylalanyl-tRNA synthetase subunit beta [Gymnopus androsaceus JB14]
MPTVSVDKAELWERLGQEFSSEDFDALCFEYGVELDEDTTAEVEEAIKQGLPLNDHSFLTLDQQLKIETPANRYDLLCIEGIARALKIFLGKAKAPHYKLVYPSKGESELLTVTIHPETICRRRKSRPLFACAILRNIKFTPSSYANICRRRQLVAIGTHDLDTLKGPFRYEARAPKDIKFAPLNKDKAYTAEELMTLYESDKQLSRYLPIIRDSPVYPIIYDAEDRVLSMPPIINSNHSKITLNTTNVFIDVTATDQTKLDIVVNMVVTMFSEYCAEPFTVEPVKMILPDGSTKISPDLSERKMLAHASYVNSCTGLSLKSEEVTKLLSKMALFPTISSTNADEIEVSIPPTRPDIFHECDIMEDAAIAYGFNNLPHTFPPTTTVGQPSAINKLSDIIRLEWALAGWVEVLPLTLCSHEENFAFLNHEDDNSTAVKIANPKTLEFQVVRTTLIPGLLKTIRENRSHSLPMKIFEAERQARNERHAAAVWCNKTAGFEIVHGVFDRAMKMLEIPRISNSDSKAVTGYYMKETSDPMFFPGRAATIYYRAPPSKRKNTTFEKLKQDAKAALHVSNDMVLGTLGILHPSVLEKFDIQYPCSAVEFTLDPFKKEMQKIWTNDE